MYMAHRVLDSKGLTQKNTQIHDTEVGAADFCGVLKLASYNTLSQDRKMRSRPYRCISLVVFCFFFLNPSFLHSSFYSAYDLGYVQVL